MKVEKIDIKKEFVDVRDDANYFDWIEKPKDFNANFPSVLPESKSLKHTTYNIVEVIDNGKRRFVGVEQEQLFKDILNIGNIELSTIKANSYDDGLRTGYINGFNQAEIKTKADIKNINWFRRLFKLF